MKRAYIGIDPGKSGGIAIVDGINAPVAWKMPDTERDLWDLLKEHWQWGDAPCFATIERVHAMPGQGVTSTFTFGMGYGGVRMALIAAGIAFEEVTPGTWQKVMGCLTKGDKNVSKAKAQQLFPTIKVTHYNADALLIAEFARRKHEGDK